LKGTQTCTVKYASPFEETRVAEATVQGPYEATRANFTAANLTSLGCGQESEHRQQGLAGGALVLFENHSQEQLIIFPLDRNGRRLSSEASVPAGGSVAEAIPASTPLVLANSAGVCKGIYIPTTQPVRVSFP